MKKLILALSVLSLLGLSVACNRGERGTGADKSGQDATDTQMEQDRSQPESGMQTSPESIAPMEDSTQDKSAPSNP